MVKIFKKNASPEISKKGYSASYVADVQFNKHLDTGGFILVSIDPGEKSAPHSHAELEEVFVALSRLRMYIDSIPYELETGDVILVEPYETHSFEALPTSEARLLAIKFPNLKTDKVEN
jgi:quercetin dioxygenase-like cupin family protein